MLDLYSEYGGVSKMTYINKNTLQKDIYLKSNMALFARKGEELTDEQKLKLEQLVKEDKIRYYGGRK